jgi:HAD superfamily hydrolase (TIGR01509 family)
MNEYIIGSSGYPPFEALLFDMDGTLFDTEARCDVMLRELLEEWGVWEEGGLDLSRHHGSTWPTIAKDLLKFLPAGVTPPTAESLLATFEESLAVVPPPEVPGARATLEAAIKEVPTSIVTSSNLTTVQLLLPAFELSEKDLLCICAEDVQNSKPAPDCYLLAADRLGVEPSRCIVFEDTVAGLSAAKAAGMFAVAISRDRTNYQRTGLSHIADRVIRNFTELPEGFFRGSFA